jgi:hypothetical protein
MDQAIKKRMKEVEQAVLDLDETVRGAAFLVMQDYILGGAGPVSEQAPPRKSRVGRSSTKTSKAEESSKIEPVADFNGFVDMFESDNESDNAKVIAAHLYREYGAEPFSLDEVRKLAKSGGVTIPERLDMTFLQATADKKKLFKRAGKGMFRPSIHGQAYFKKTYNVKMGTKKRPAATSEPT